MNRIISHPEYDYTSFEHDIALVRLTEPLEYGELVSTSYSHNKVFFSVTRLIGGRGAPD